MEAIFINRELTKSEETGILNKVSSGSDYALYSNVELSEKLSTYSKGLIELTPEEKKKINYDIFDKVIRFGEIKINGKAITDLLMIEKASIWHYHKFRTYFNLTNLFYEIEILNKLTSKFPSIVSFSANKLLIEYFKAKSITIKLPQKDSNKFINASLFYYLIFFLSRVFLGSFQTKKIRFANHLIIDHTIKQICLNIDNLKPELGNYNLQYLFDKADDSFIILDDVEIPKFHKETKFKLKPYLFKKDKNRMFGEHVLFRGFFSRIIWKGLKEHLTYLQNQYGIIEPILQDPTDKLILETLKSLHYSNKLFIFKYLAYKLFFQKHSFKSISSIDENSPRIKSILDAAKNNNITTFGIQHGVIHDLQPNYHFTTKDKTRKVTPDYTLVWGSYWQNKLYVEGKYPKDTLIKTGFIRTDIIPKLATTKTNNILNVKDNRKLVVFASQPIADKSIRKQIAFEIFTSLRDIKDSILVVKLHPAETNDIAYYKAIAKEAGLSEVIFTSEIDLYLLLSKAKIIITSFSTVGLESVFFNKPFIIIDPLKQDVQNYYRDGIAFQATNAKELTSLISKIINGDLSLSQKNYSAYLIDQVTKIDGNVSNRCLDIIKKYSNK